MALKLNVGQWGFVAVVALMAVTIYMAFAFPTGFFHLKQSETTELKSVIVVSRNGDQSPSSESFFIGEEPPEDLNSYGYDQLTNVSNRIQCKLAQQFAREMCSHLTRCVFTNSMYADWQKSHVHAWKVPEN